MAHALTFSIYRTAVRVSAVLKHQENLVEHICRVIGVCRCKPLAAKGGLLAAHKRKHLFLHGSVWPSLFLYGSFMPLLDTSCTRQGMHCSYWRLHDSMAPVSAAGRSFSGAGCTWRTPGTSWGRSAGTATRASQRHSEGECRPSIALSLALTPCGFLHRSPLRREAS